MTRNIVCYRCKIEFHVPDYWWQTRQQDHMNFWCPNGHQQHFIEGELEETTLRRERDRLKQQLAEKDDAIRAHAAATEVIRKKLKRTEKRITAGLCQCCNRSFVNMQRHMKTQHPEFACDSPKLKVVK